MRDTTKTIYTECDRIADGFKHNAVVRKCEKSHNWHQTWTDIYTTYARRVNDMWNIAETTAAEKRIESCTALITSRMHDAKKYMEEREVAR